MKACKYQKQKHQISIGFVWVISIALLSNCTFDYQAEQPTTMPERTSTAVPIHVHTPETPTTLLPDKLIGEILASPGDFAGKQVEITGYFRGWNLLREVSTASPVTRSDWVIADQSGAIYVSGLVPESLDPSSIDSVWTIVHLSASVEYNEQGVYLIAQSVKVLPGN